jgi:hypothetical protein
MFRAEADYREITRMGDRVFVGFKSKHLTCAENGARMASRLAIPSTAILGRGFGENKLNCAPSGSRPLKYPVVRETLPSVSGKRWAVFCLRVVPRPAQQSENRYWGIRCYPAAGFGVDSTRDRNRDTIRRSAQISRS